MKHDIIKTDDYLLVVDESEIKGWYYDAYINKVKHSGGAEYGESIITRNIIAHLPLNGSPILEGVVLLPPLEDDVEKLALDLFPRHENWTLNSDNAEKRPIWVDGYNKAKEKYKYTEEDLKNAMFYALHHPTEENVMIISKDSIVRKPLTKDSIVRKIIQSLSQPKMPIGFECAMKSIPCPDNKPDCIVCHMGIMTTTTPEGHTQWVGTYIFN